MFFKAGGNLKLLTKFSAKLRELKYRERECEHQGRRECDLPETFFDPEALQIDNAPWFVNENHNQRAPSEGISGIGIPPVHLHFCRPSSMQTILRKRSELWQKAKTPALRGAQIQILESQLTAAVGMLHYCREKKKPIRR